MQYPDSELILNGDGSVYHLRLRPEQLADTIVTVGDPERVAMVSRHFDAITYRVAHREFVTHTGTYSGRAISVISTGIGTDNIDIVLNELDALASIDLSQRIPLSPRARRQLTFIRIGTSGALHPDLEVGSILLSRYAVGLDGLMAYYRDTAERQVSPLAHQVTDRLQPPLPPYAFGADQRLFDHFLSSDTHAGITATCTGFYAPQGRQLRLAALTPDWLDRLATIHYDGLRLTNFEMETAGIYALAHLLGHRALSINLLLANRATGTFADNAGQLMEDTIVWALDRLANL